MLDDSSNIESTKKTLDVCTCELKYECHRSVHRMFDPQRFASLSAAYATAVPSTANCYLDG